MSSELLSSILALHSKVDGVNDKVDKLSDAFNKLDCKVNNNKIVNLEKVVYGFVKIVLVAFAVGVIALVMTNGHGNKKATAKAVISKSIK